MARPSYTHGSGRQGEFAPGRGARGLLPPPPSRRGGGQRSAALATPGATQAPRGAFCRVLAGPGECAWDSKGSLGARCGRELVRLRRRQRRKEGRERGTEEGREGGGAQRRAPGGEKRGWGSRAPVPISAGKWRNRHKAFVGKVSCSQGRTCRPVPRRGRGEEGAGEFALSCVVVATACFGRGEDGSLLPSSLRGRAAAPGSGWAPAPFLFPCSTACSPPPAAGAPARPPSSLLLPASPRRWRAPWAGAPGTLLGQAAAERCALCAPAGAGTPLGSAPTPAAVLKGQLPGCCGAARGPAGVHPAGFGLWGQWALAPAPLSPALRAPLRPGGWRCRRRRRGYDGRAREAGVAGPGAVR